MLLNNLNEKAGIFLSICGGVLGFLFGDFDMPLKVFMVVLFVDTASGMLKGYYNGTYESKKFRQGIFRKCGYLLAIMLAVQLDNLAGGTSAWRTAFLFCFIANEGTSIIENLGAMGVQFPEGVTNAIASLKGKNKDKDKEK